MTDERYSRQKDLVPTEALKASHVGIAGCGAIGRQLAIQLATMGVGHLIYADFDTVEAGNMGAQGWSPADVGKLKVNALTEELVRINPDISLTPHPRRYGQYVDAGVLFLCVDRMEARRELFDAHGPHDIELIIDARMAADTIRILAVDQSHEAAENWDQNRDAYAETLFTDAEAFQGSCTTKGTIYMANMAAALMVRQYVAWLRDEPFASDLTLAMASMELSSNS